MKSTARQHIGHRLYLKNLVSGHFAGKRMITRLERCLSCNNVLVSISQNEQRRTSAPAIRVNS